MIKFCLIVLTLFDDVAQAHVQLNYWVNAREYLENNFEKNDTVDLNTVTDFLQVQGFNYILF